SGVDDSTKLQIREVRTGRGLEFCSGEIDTRDAGPSAVSGDPLCIKSPICITVERDTEHSIIRTASSPRKIRRDQLANGSNAQTRLNACATIRKTLILKCGRSRTMSISRNFSRSGPVLCGCQHIANIDITTYVDETADETKRLRHLLQVRMDRRCKRRSN